MVLGSLLAVSTISLPCVLAVPAVVTQIPALRYTGKRQMTYPKSLQYSPCDFQIWMMRVNWAFFLFAAQLAAQLENPSL